MKNIKKIIVLVVVIMFIGCTTCLADAIVDPDIIKKTPKPTTSMTVPLPSATNTQSNTTIIDNTTNTTNTTKKTAKDEKESDSELSEKIKEHVEEYLVFDILVLLAVVVGISLIIAIALDKKDRKANK